MFIIAKSYGSLSPVITTEKDGWKAWKAFVEHIVAGYPVTVKFMGWLGGKEDYRVGCAEANNKGETHAYFC